MRGTRCTLEDQVGGLISRAHPREQRREPLPVTTSEELEPQGYGLTAQATATIRATRAAGDSPDQRAA